MPDNSALIMALPNPVILVGGGGRVVGLNGAATGMIGVDCTGWHYITALRQPALLDAVEATLQDRGQRVVHYLGNDGARDTTWDVTVNALADAGAVTVVLSFQDMTAVQEAGEMRRDFVANVSHEMRTPLTSMMGFIETLQGPARDDTAARTRFLSMMGQEAERLHSLVEDLLQLSRVEGQERERPTEQVTLQDVVHEVVSALKPRAEERSVRLVTDLPDAPVTILGDKGQLWQVIRNLVENAIKYGADAGDVTVRLTAPDHHDSLRRTGVAISVIDQGEGIPAHHIARLTERFYRVDTHRSREVGGTGLGLAIVKHIINRHRGRLRIQSTPGQGTEFKVILPIGPTDPTE